MPPLAGWFIRLVGASAKWETRGLEHWPHASGQHSPSIFAFWHETVALAAYYFRDTGYLTLTSVSFDGELAARIVRRMGMDAARGSSSRRGLQALAELRRALDAGNTIGFPVDGPRGPRRVVKPGVCILAAKTGLPVLPIAFAPSRAWRLGSWDRFQIPKPFARIACAIGPPIPPPNAVKSGEVEAQRKEVDEALNALHAELEGGSETKPAAAPPAD